MVRGGTPFTRATCLARVRKITVAAAAVVALLAMAAPAGAHRRHRPAPRCGWASASLINRTLGINVRPAKAHWRVNIAPVLTCSSYEVEPTLAPIGEPIVTIAFAEVQRFRVPSTFSFVPHLGSCIEHSSCPRPHKPAWLYVQRTTTNSEFTNPFPAIEQLRVEDGVNALAIQMFTPNGPPAVASETAAVLKLARKLLPRFYWR
jgi:hypothetical protein